MTISQAPNLVVDASVIVAYFVETDEHHSKVLPYWDNLERGQGRFHIPMLATVETAAAIYRPARNRTQAYALANAVVYQLEYLTQSDQVLQYPLNEDRKHQSVLMALHYRLKGADAVYCALSQELQVPLLTTDRDFRDYPNAVVLA